MSLIFAADLLRQYNKGSRKPIDNSNKTQLGAWSYANTYDALFERFKSNKNFNLDMWHQSIKAGEQDMYLSLLEQNKDTALSNAFYDPQYYNYEAMMLELYKPLADGDIEKAIAREREVWDPQTQKFVMENLGDMTDQQWIQYQLDQTHEIRTAEITRAIEQQRKDQMSWLEKMAHSTAATFAEFGEGLTTALAGILDFAIAPIAAFGIMDKDTNWLDAYVEYYGDKGLIATEKRTIREALDEYERTHTYIRDIDGNMTPVGKYVAGITNSIGMMIPAILINMVAPGVGMPLFYTSVYGQNVHENALNPAIKDSPSWLKITNAAVKSGIEVVVEMGLNKMLGGTLQNQLLGLSGKGIIKEFGKQAGVKFLLKSSFQEGLEEFLQDFSTNLVDQFTGMIYEGYQHTGVNFQTLVDSFAIGMLSSIFMSGGAVAHNAIMSKATKGKTDTYIENKDGSIQKLKGLQKLAWSSMMQDFQEALKTLSENKMSIGKNLKLAQEVYGGMTVMTQFYQSFSTDRIKNAERLLQRVSKAEQSQSVNKYNLTSKEKVSVQKDYDTAQRENIKIFANTIYQEFSSMIGDVKTRHNERIKQAIDVSSDKLKKGEVTSIKSATHTDGAKYKKDPAMTALEEMIQGKVDTLSKDYEWVFTTDGHVAVETDGMLFISEAWLENYETSEIYKYLAQSQILDTILKDKELEPLLKDAVKHNKKFTGNKSVDTEQALMDLLFNKSVYQHFLLSNKGNNVHNFKDFIFRLHELIKMLGETEPKMNKTRKAMLNKIYEQIKDTMREPTIKAIVNWNMNPQLIGADSILTDTDKQFVHQYQVRKKVAADSVKGGKVSSAYERLAKDLRENGQFNDAEKTLIDRGLSEKATNDDRLMAVALLNEADIRYVNFDFVIRAIKRNSERALQILDEILLMEQTVDNTPEFKDMLIKSVNDFMASAEDVVSFTLDGLIDISKTSAEIISVFKEIAEFTKTDIKNKLKSLQTNNTSPGIFAIPPQAIARGKDLSAYIQFKADILNQFRNEYGIDAASFMIEGFINLSETQRDKIRLEMEVLGIDDDNFVKFVITKLENRLGDEYIVTPTYDVHKNDTEPIIKNFEIVEKIQAEDLIIPELLKPDIDEQNVAFIDMFEKTTFGRYKFRKVKDFIKIDKAGKSSIKNIGNWDIKIINNPDVNWSGSTFEKDNFIFINIAISDNFLRDFVHEINHAIQHEYKLTGGFSDETALVMPDFMNHVLYNYPELVIYVLRRMGEDPAIFYMQENFSRSKSINEIFGRYEGIAERAIAYIAYRLIQGELWAEHYMHNGKLVHGYTMQQLPNGESYVVSPDDLERFKMPYNNTASHKITVNNITKPDPIYTQNAMERNFNEIFNARSEGYIDNKKIRETYHAKFTKNASEFIQKIINKGLPITTQIRVTLNEIILNPEQYLSQDILDKMKSKRGEITEGSVYHFLKDWFEKNNDGVSIDRDGTTHEYLFVNDNAFDDLLTGELSNVKQDDNNNDLVKKYTSVDGFNLNRFYNLLQLSRLGLPSDIRVIANENVLNETVFNRSYPNGVINIHIDSLTTNAEFIDKLNHEFRHILQYHNNFELGFTPKFKVTQDMIVDLKKNVPEIFKNKELIDIAKYNNVDSDIFVAQRFVYYMIGGEQNAYGIRSTLLNTKPAYAMTEAGKPTIFMPWYNAKTGDGRYQTEFLAARADDTDLFKVKRKPKHVSGVIDDISADKPKKTYKYNRNRSFTKEEAKGTNLEAFTKTGVPGDMDPDLKNFIVATTGNLDKLPKELAHAIRKGINTAKPLNKQRFYRWFREANAKDINDFTFNLINKHIFKNTAIKNMTELERLTNVDVSFWWAASIVLKQEGLVDENFDIPNDVNKFLDIIKSLEGSKWKAKIDKMRQSFNWYFVEGKDGGQKRIEIPMDQATAEYMRVFAMQYFDGTLAGAFYTARTLRHVVRLYQNRNTDIRLDTPIGDGNVSLKDVITKENLPSEIKGVSDSIIAMYEADVFGKSTDEMIAELGLAAKNFFERKANQQAEKLTNLTDTQKKKLIDKGVREKVLNYISRLKNDMSPEDVAIRYQQLHDADMIGLATRVDITNTDKDITSELRVNIVQRVNRAANRLLKYVNKGRAVWINLPEEVRDLFRPIEIKKGRKKWKNFELKPEAYSVGKGRIKQDTSKILHNAELLKKTADDARDFIFAIKETSKKVDKLERENARKTREIVKLSTENIKMKRNVKETEFNIKKRTRTVDQPNNFTIVSGIDMPPVLRKIFDVSFDELANTEVQFISKDKDGNLYEKGTKQFDAAQKHEVKNWDVFYETVRPQLLSLTRIDILDIVEFIQSGAQTIDGPSGKLAAFQIFMLGYIVDGARRNFNNWNFSDAEKEVIEKLYEQKAHDAGSALNAVSQMIKVIDPIKKIRQRMLENYNITDVELEPLLNAVDKLQQEKDLNTRKTQAVEVEKEVRKIEQMMIDNDVTERGWGKRWYQKLKSARYSFMLSSPITWVRNSVSNVVNSLFNKSADYLSKFVFTGLGKKAYREGQWDITGTQISNDVKTFIDNNIKKSELFELLYDGTTKYDDRGKRVIQQRELFVTMIVNSLERKYAAEHKFDNTTANFLANFVNKMISDKPFIKVASTRYLGKILTIESAKGNIDLSQGLTNEVLNYFAEAVILANTEYMRKRSFFADMTDSLREKHPIVYEVINWWQPFLNSSFNWFQETLKYTPMGLVGAISRMVKLEKQITKLDERRAKGELVTDSRAAEHLVRRDVGKGIVGLILLTLGITLGMTGIVKIDEDDDKFYMIIGNMKIDISNIFGTSSVIVGVSLAQVGKMEIDDIMRHVAESMLEGFVLKDILDRHRWDNGAYEMMLTETEGILRSFVPQLVQVFIRATNNQQIKYTKGMKGMWERWLNSFIPTQPFGSRKTNPYTGETGTKYALPFVGELLKSGILGPNIFWSEVSEVEALAREYGVNKNEIDPEITINGEKQNLGDKRLLNEKYGSLNKKSLAELQQGRHNVQMPDGSFKVLSWSEMSDLQKTRVISRIMTQNAEIAKIFVWTKLMNNKYYATDSLWILLKKLGITKNVFRGDKGFVK